VITSANLNKFEYHLLNLISQKLKKKNISF